MRGSVCEREREWQCKCNVRNNDRPGKRCGEAGCTLKWHQHQAHCLPNKRQFCHQVQLQHLSQGNCSRCWWYRPWTTAQNTDGGQKEEEKEIKGGKRNPPRRSPQFWYRLSWHRDSPSRLVGPISVSNRSWKQYPTKTPRGPRWTSYTSPDTDEDDDDKLIMVLVKSIRLDVVVCTENEQTNR